VWKLEASAMPHYGLRFAKPAAALFFNIFFAKSLYNLKGFIILAHHKSFSLFT
jgi:hypothetical protein